MMAVIVLMVVSARRTGNGYLGTHNDSNNTLGYTLTQQLIMTKSSNYYFPNLSPVKKVGESSWGSHEYVAPIFNLSQLVAHASATVYNHRTVDGLVSEFPSFVVDLQRQFAGW